MLGCKRDGCGIDSQLRNELFLFFFLALVIRQSAALYYYAEIGTQLNAIKKIELLKTMHMMILEAGISIIDNFQ